MTCMGSREKNTQYVDFAQVGGLSDHIRCLTEMILFPLIYREIYERFHIKPPHGVLFHGPPGTGKTLIAKALCNECSRYDRRVTFFCRKGADILSKWVGDSERNLRCLFEQAQQKHPSIIFFDEIDGLAPTRSDRQDQVHSSVVSTLLALMDGLDTRTDVIVIGATNRLNSIDPALRRPGRFDRELFFPLPTFGARKDIIQLHLDQWNEHNKPCREFIEELASNTVGYSGADLHALCSEAAMCSLRRQYPQIYSTSHRVRVNYRSFTVEKQDFLLAKSKIVPLAHRTLHSPGKRIPRIILPLLQNKMERVLGAIHAFHPFKFLNPDCKDYSPTDLFSSPRLLLTGSCQQGQTTYLAPAILHHLEHLPVYTLDITALYENSRSEEACIQKMNEMYQNLPAILYTPGINTWWDVVDEATRVVFLSQVGNIKSSIPVFLLSTSHTPYQFLSPPLRQLFNPYQHQVIEMENPTLESRRDFFRLLIIKCILPPPKKPRGLGSSTNFNGNNREDYCSTKRRNNFKIQETSKSQNKAHNCRCRGLSTLSHAGTSKARSPPTHFDSLEDGVSIPKRVKLESKQEYLNVTIKQEDASGDDMFLITPDDFSRAMECYNVTNVNLSDRNRVVISRERLAELLSVVVDLTNDWPIQMLEGLYSQLNTCIVCYQDKWERTQLIHVRTVALHEGCPKFPDRSSKDILLLSMDLERVVHKFRNEQRN